MRRRVFLFASLAGPLVADVSDQIYNLFISMATALSGAEPDRFLQAFDHAMPDYEKLSRYIEAITSQSDIVSSIDILSDEGDEKARTVELDWLLQLTAPLMPVVRRRQKIKCRVARQGRKWKVVSLDPVEFFAPVRP